MAETTELVGLTLARQAELPRCTALAGWSELVAETGLDAGSALVLVTPTELIESTEALEILVEPSAGTLVASPTALAELAEILEPVELPELVGPVELVGALAGLAGLVQPAEPLAEMPAELVVELAGLVGRPYSRR